MVNRLMGGDRPPPNSAVYPLTLPIVSPAAM
jgi:hypothetical protein